MLGAAEDGEYGEIGVMVSPELAVRVAQAMNRDLHPEWRDDTYMLLPKLNELMLYERLSPERRMRLREVSDAFAEAVFWAAGALAGASLEMAGLLTPGQEPFEPDEPDPAPIDPERPDA